MRPLLTVEDLSIAFGDVGPPVVEGVSFALDAGETLALVGESGSGKTLSAKALIGLLPRAAQLRAGRAIFRAPGGEVDLLRLPAPALRRLRGQTISMVFQEPMSALSPLHRVGAQVGEVLRVHGYEGSVEDRVLEVLDEVGFPDPRRAHDAFPFELSGGLRQRAVIAMAMVGNPKLVIADEPTTALDVTTQATVLELLRRLGRDHALAVILITHDLGVVANMADRVVVLNRGRIMEAGGCSRVLSAPGHPYTRALVAAAPRPPSPLASCGAAAEGTAILSVSGLSKTYPGRTRTFGPPAPPVRAVADFALCLERGRTVAVVGESGSGKSTVAKLITRAERPDPGARMVFRPEAGGEEDISTLSGAGLKAYRRECQMVFQDPYAALSPRLSVQDILTEPLEIHGIGNRAERRARAAALMERVGLSAGHLGRFPHAFSGGQRQRIAIARALALEPELLICDEPTSALDVSVQAEVLAMLEELQAELGLSMVFISHDLTVVSHIADRILVMRRGRVVEEGDPACVFGKPRHPYTRALIAASPEPDTERRLDLKLVAAGAGEPEDWPAPYGYVEGDAPGLVEIAPGHLVRAAA
ncbi:ABC transporter ATP-binding protein [Paralimibaculum aggregatum]|uniref:ABC transporter ATP-binding protein n=1 Tax=Paralimibaculum aggregatum TaxID=3036245 RepID=A0ABQ6LRH4_9RHOB|nr:ABC transporter ATP-binding protein [Limibaculum sp. NKW23]GMG83796.1 ABC transporter ATP-binding protein [Limibaculum sp. NKW23]